MAELFLKQKTGCLKPTSRSCRRFIPEPEFQQWMEDYSRAQTSMQDQSWLQVSYCRCSKKTYFHLCRKDRESALAKVAGKIERYGPVRLKRLKMIIISFI